MGVHAEGISPRKTCKTSGSSGSGRLNFDLGYFNEEGAFVDTPLTLVITATRL
jgi:hypothetical protein